MTSECLAMRRVFEQWGHGKELVLNGEVEKWQKIQEIIGVTIPIYREEGDGRLCLAFHL